MDTRINIYYVDCPYCGNKNRLDRDYKKVSKNIYCCRVCDCDFVFSVSVVTEIKTFKIEGAENK